MSDKNYDALELLARADSFEIVNLRCFEHDDDRGDDYVDYDINSHEVRSQLKALIYNCFKMLEDDKKRTRALLEAQQQLASLKESYEALKAKIKALT